MSDAGKPKTFYQLSPKLHRQFAKELGGRPNKRECKVIFSEYREPAATKLVESVPLSARNAPWQVVVWGFVEPILLSRRLTARELKVVTFQPCLTRPANPPGEMPSFTPVNDGVLGTIARQERNPLYNPRAPKPSRW